VRHDVKRCTDIDFMGLGGGVIKKLRPFSVPAPKCMSQAREFGLTCSVTLINNTVLSVKISID
jgi:hypothetical protein